MAHPRAGQLAQPDDLIDVEALIGAYYDGVPDVANPSERVSFGTSGHRGSSFDKAFNEAHITAITQAIIDYRRLNGITGPVMIAKDTHALSLPAWKTALEVLSAADIEILTSTADEFTPTPALSRAVLDYNATHATAPADGIVITPSHNPPRDGGFKYNPPTGGPADTDVTRWIEQRANELLPTWESIQRIPYERTMPAYFDFRHLYCSQLPRIINLEAIAKSQISIGADPMGGASVEYWGYIAELYGLNLTVVNDEVDSRWAFMTLDTDGQIRMDCSSAHAMASLIGNRNLYDIATGNDADADRHGIVTPDGGLMNPNHFLAVAIDYLFTTRTVWPSTIGIGKTLVSSSIIDKVAQRLHRRLTEVPVGFKWFVDGLSNGTLGFGGEESAGASFLTLDGQTWTTDKDGIIMDLLASEIFATTGKSPSEHYREIEKAFGTSFYGRTDSQATREEKDRLQALSPADVPAESLAGEKVTGVFTHAPGNHAPIGGIKVTTASGWFAARPSGTEDKYKIYAESLRSAEHLEAIQNEGARVVATALGTVS